MTPDEPETTNELVHDAADAASECSVATLDALSRPPAPSPSWPDSAHLAHTVRRRRRLRAGSAVVLAAAVAVSVIVPNVGGDSRLAAPVAAGNPNLRVAGQLGAASELVAPVTTGSPVSGNRSAITRVAQSEQAFTVALLRQLDASGSTDGSANLSVSPTSLALALAMLQNGARGQTLRQIQKTLRSTGLSTATQDAGWAGLVAGWAAAAAKDKVSLESANSVWMQQGLKLRAGFMAALSRYYASGVWQVDFGDMPAALAAMNRWTSQHTHGRIKKLFDQLDPSTVLVLANAVYFKAAWQQEFDPSSTAPSRFTLSSGKTVRTAFMNSHGANGSTEVATGAGYQAAQLPYHGGRFAALAIMPTTGSLSDYINRLTPSALSGITAALTTPSDLNLSLPRFTTSSILPLNDTLAALGMPAAFGGGANFSGLSPTPLQIGDSIQRVYVKVDEQGTEAAAVTGIGVQTSALAASPLTVRFNHPFLFLIRDTQTGTILFASQINNPAAG